MKLTILVSVLASHEIVRRQLIYLAGLGLSDDIELLLIDDGSNPPITANGCGLSNLRIHATNDCRPWTQQIARNLGAAMAQGEYLLCTDIDHVLSRQAIETVRAGQYDVVRFRRELGLLDSNGQFTQDRMLLSTWCVPPERLAEGKRLRISPHSNSYGIRRDLFIELGGSRVDRNAVYPQRDEIPIKRRIKRLQAEGKISVIPDELRPTIYMIPNGRYCGDIDSNPFGYFHALSRKTPANRSWQEEQHAS